MTKHERAIIFRQRARDLLFVLIILGLMIHPLNGDTRVAAAFGVLLVYIAALIYQLKRHQIMRWRSSLVRGDKANTLGTIMIYNWSLCTILYLCYLFFSSYGLIT